MMYHGAFSLNGTETKRFLESKSFRLCWNFRIRDNPLSVASLDCYVFDHEELSLHLAGDVLP